MLSYTKRCVNFVTLFFTILIFSLIIFSQMYLEEKNKYKNIINNSYNQDYGKHVYFTSIALSKIKKENRIIGEEIKIAKQRYEQTKKLESSLIKEKLKVGKNSKKTSMQKQIKTAEIDIYRTNPWRIKIQKLQLDAPISEGTTQEALRRTVGHFEGTSTWSGNIVLAGHNRGYRCNFFQEIKELEKGDTIIYCTTQGEKKYKVMLNKIIKETDWSYVEPTKENKITLITCEKNKKEYRRCIQAIEIK